MVLWWKDVRLVTACLLAFFAVPQNLNAETHVVSPADLQKAAIAATQSRQHNIETIQGFLSSANAEKALKAAHLNPEQIKWAVSSLNDHELAQLATRASKAQTDFAAGKMSDRDLLIIVVAIAALILIIVAVR